MGDTDVMTRKALTTKKRKTTERKDNARITESALKKKRNVTITGV